MSEFWLGLRGGLRGVGLVWRDAELRRGWRWLALAWALVWLLALTAGLAVDDHAADWLLGQLPPAQPDAGWWAFSWRKSMHWLVYPLVWLTAWLAAWTLSLPVLSPLLTLWAEAVQRRQGADLTPLAWRDLVAEAMRGIGRSLVLAAAELVSTVAVSAMGWVVALALPGVGALLQTAGLLVWHLLWRAMLVASFALENNGSPLRNQLSLLRRAPLRLVGLGVVAAPLCALVPFAPLGVAAGTVVMLELAAQGRLQLPRALPLPPRHNPLG